MTEIRSVVNTSFRYLHVLFYNIKQVNKHLMFEFKGLKGYSGVSLIHGLTHLDTEYGPPVER